MTIGESYYTPPPSDLTKDLPVTEEPPPLEQPIENPENPEQPDPEQGGGQENPEGGDPNSDPGGGDPNSDPGEGDPSNGECDVTPDKPSIVVEVEKGDKDYWSLSNDQLEEMQKTAQSDITAIENSQKCSAYIDDLVPQLSQPKTGGNLNIFNAMDPIALLQVIIRNVMRETRHLQHASSLIKSSINVEQLGIALASAALKRDAALMNAYKSFGLAATSAANAGAQYSQMRKMQRLNSLAGERGGEAEIKAGQEKTEQELKANEEKMAQTKEQLKQEKDQLSKDPAKAGKKEYKELKKEIKQLEKDYKNETNEDKKGEIEGKLKEAKEKRDHNPYHIQKQKVKDVEKEVKNLGNENERLNESLEDKQKALQALGDLNLLGKETNQEEKEKQGSEFTLRDKNQQSEFSIKEANQGGEERKITLREEPGEQENITTPQEDNLLENPKENAPQNLQKGQIAITDKKTSPSTENISPEVVQNPQIKQNQKPAEQQADPLLKQNQETAEQQADPLLKQNQETAEQQADPLLKQNQETAEQQADPKLKQAGGGENNSEQSAGAEQSSKNISASPQNSNDSDGKDGKESKDDGLSNPFTDRIHRETRILDMKSQITQSLFKVIEKSIEGATDMQAAEDNFEASRLDAFRENTRQIGEDIGKTVDELSRFYDEMMRTLGEIQQHQEQLTNQIFTSSRG